MSQTHRNEEKFFPDDPPTGMEVKAEASYLMDGCVHMEIQTVGLYKLFLDLPFN